MLIVSMTVVSLHDHTANIIMTLTLGPAAAAASATAIRQTHEHQQETHPESPRMMTLRRTFFRDAMILADVVVGGKGVDDGVKKGQGKRKEVRRGVSGIDAAANKSSRSEERMSLRVAVCWSAGMQQMLSQPDWE